MTDDGFHEIQLGKKQLVFLFMAAAVFSVVVFLIGVWVGREVQRPDGEILSDVPIADAASADATPPPTEIAPNELDYTARLQTEPQTGTKTGVPAKPGEPPKVVESAPAGDPAAAAKGAVAAPAPATPPPGASNAAPSTGGLLLQVGAFTGQAEADGLVTRLKAKGYTAFVFAAPAGTLGPRFKVRVGPFADRAEADRIAARLRKEEGFSPFVTR